MKPSSVASAPATARHGSNHHTILFNICMVQADSQTSKNVQIKEALHLNNDKAM
jgi:hypothetical protein